MAAWPGWRSVRRRCSAWRRPRPSSPSRRRPGTASPAERPALIERFSIRTFQTGDKIVTQGAETEGLHLIALGEVAVVHRDEKDDSATIVSERLAPVRTPPLHAGTAS